MVRKLLHFQGDSVNGSFVGIFIGVGETLRGTVLGAVDTMGNKSGMPSKNDEIAKQGRLEIERGLGHWKGTSPTSHTASGGNYAGSATTQPTNGYHARDMTGSGTTAPAASQAQGTTGTDTGKPSGGGLADPAGLAAGDPSKGEHINLATISSLTDHKVTHRLRRR
jgi:hypothetical protein